MERHGKATRIARNVVLLVVGHRGILPSHDEKPQRQGGHFDPTLAKDYEQGPCSILRWIYPELC